MLTRRFRVIRLCLGGAVWGSLLGIVLGTLLGMVYGAFAGDVTLGLDGAVLGCLSLGLLGALYGCSLAMRGTPPHAPPHRPAELTGGAALESRMAGSLDVRG